MKTLIGLLVALLSLPLVATVRAQTGKWEIPPRAKTEQSPLKTSPALLKSGQTIFQARCRKCHGPEGKGNGAQADPNSKPADLTASKADQNPDGVLFYKIGNGQAPIMPAFKGQLTPNEIWTVIAYVKSLRKTS